jgi:hypothetical protein
MIDTSIPRRVDRRRMIRTEIRISDLQRDVEAFGADLRLTKCVTLLAKAREQFADFVDGVVKAPETPQAVRIIEKMRDDYIREHCQTFNDGHWVGTNAQNEHVSTLDGIISALSLEVNKEGA